MATVKVIELLAGSTKSWTDAVDQAVKKANKTLRGVKSAHVQNMSVTVENGKIKEYRVNVKISFAVE
jgi:dodecin